MRCIALSGGPIENVESSNLHSSQHVQAMNELAFIFYKLDQPTHASALLKGIMPKVYIILSLFFFVFFFF